jgi:hypothetical protein
MAEQIDMEEYLKNRVEDQYVYFNKNAVKNKRFYHILKILAICCNILTVLTIAMVFVVQGEEYSKCLSILALILSTIVLATYQVEEFMNFGAKWEKFRLVAEWIKSEKYLYLNKTGKYNQELQADINKEFVSTIEKILKSTDLSFFALIVEPGRRIEKRMEQTGNF